MNRDLPKLVRDRCQELYPTNVYRLAGFTDELGELLDKKIKEELGEVTEAAKTGTHEDVINECADLWEVMEAYFDYLGVSKRSVLAARFSKIEARGAFAMGLVMEECSLWQKK